MPNKIGLGPIGATTTIMGIIGTIEEGPGVQIGATGGAVPGGPTLMDHLVTNPPLKISTLTFRPGKVLRFGIIHTGITRITGHLFSWTTKDILEVQRPVTMATRDRRGTMPLRCRSCQCRVSGGTVHIQCTGDLLFILTAPMVPMSCLLTGTRHHG